MTESNNDSSRLRRSSTSSSARSVSRRSLRDANRQSKAKSRLHLMSATGYTQEPEMTFPRRLYKFMSLPNFSEYFMSVDHHQIWRRHLAWSLRDGNHLRNAVTSRFASNMVFMSLLLGTEIGVLFSPSKPADRFRAALQNTAYGDVNFWAAIVLCMSIGLTLSTLVANFTAWAIIGAVSPQNSHAILRSSVGLDAAQLPARLVILSIYCFVVWVMMFIWILLPPVWGYVIALFPVVLIGYIVVLYSSFGRLVIYSRAMQHREIFTEEEDVHMSSRRLFEELLKKAEKVKEKRSPLPLYYRSRGELHKHLSDLRDIEQEQYVDMGFGSVHAAQYVNRILDSSRHCNGHLSHILSGDGMEEREGTDEMCNGGDQGQGLPQNPTEFEDFSENDEQGRATSNGHEEGGGSSEQLSLSTSSKATLRSGRRRGANPAMRRAIERENYERFSRRMNSQSGHRPSLIRDEYSCRSDDSKRGRGGESSRKILENSAGMGSIAMAL